MKKNITYLWFCLMAVFGVVSCSDIDEVYSPDEDYNVTFQLNVPESGLSTREGLVNPENLISTVDLFLYPTGQTDQNAEVVRLNISTDIENVATINSTLSGDEMNRLFPNGATSCAAFAIVNRPTATPIAETDPTDIESLQKLALQCTVFSERIQLDAEGEGSTENLDNDDWYKTKVPNNFVMSGTATDIALENNKVTGNIDVKRTAAKITVKITDLEDEIEVENTNGTTTTWVPDKNNMRIHFKKGQTKGFIDDPETAPAEDGIFTSRDLWLDVKTEGNSTYYTTVVPIYTYPTNWNNDFSRRSSITICVPWTVKGTNTPKDTYYEIPIDDVEDMIKSNYHYEISLEIGVLGSDVEEEPVTLINCSYVILPWGETMKVSPEIGTVRYLAVDENYVVMNNVVSYRINYSSSHPVKVELDTLYRKDITGNIWKWNNEKKSTSNPGGLRDRNGEKDYFTYNLRTDDKGTFILIEHDLWNTDDKDGDYTDYKIVLNLTHSDDAPVAKNYTEKITAIQHPMVVADADINSDFDKSQSDNMSASTHDDNNGYVFVNGKRSDGTYYGYSDTEFNDLNISNYYWVYYGYYYGGTHGLAGQNTNPNRYIIKATSLSTDKYVIGDPRTKTINNDLSQTTIGSTTTSPTQASWSAYVNNQRSNEGTYSRYTTYNNRRVYAFTNDNIPQQRTYYAYALHHNNTNNRNKLLYYHPTDETDALTKNMISPEFMVASSYGVCTTGRTRVEARRRCASYQEDGYPAGRWRLPTKAEIEYIVRLSSWGIIPYLFGNNDINTDSPSPYWSANGLVSVNNYSQLSEDQHVTDGGDESRASVRCVYDLWYWTDKIPDANKSNFYWGDKQTFY